MRCCQASRRGWGTSLAMKVWWERAEQHKKFPPCSPGRLGEMVPFTQGGNHLPGDRPLEKGTGMDPTARLTGSGTHPRILAPAPTLRQDPDHRAWHRQHPLKQLLQKQPLKPGSSVGARRGAQRSLLLCFPSRLAPVRPGSHCVGPQGSDCLAAPTDGWHQPRASSPAPRAPSTSLGLGDPRAKNSLPGPCPCGSG